MKKLKESPLRPQWLTLLITLTNRWRWPKAHRLLNGQNGRKIEKILRSQDEISIAIIICCRFHRHSLPSVVGWFPPHCSYFPDRQPNMAECRNAFDVKPRVGRQIRMIFCDQITRGFYYLVLPFLWPWWITEDDQNPTGVWITKMIGKMNDLQLSGLKMKCQFLNITNVTGCRFHHLFHRLQLWAGSRLSLLISLTNNRIWRNTSYRSARDITGRSRWSVTTK